MLFLRVHHRCFGHRIRAFCKRDGSCEDRMEGGNLGAGLMKREREGGQKDGE